MKKNLFKVLMLSALMLPQLAAAFPKFDKADEIAPLIAALANDNERVTIDGVRYKIEFESTIVKDKIKSTILNLMNTIAHADNVKPAKIKKLLPLLAIVFQDKHTKNDIWKLVKANDPAITRMEFDNKYQTVKQIIDSMINTIKKTIQEKDLQILLDTLKLKSFFEYKKSYCANNKQTYESKVIGILGNFTLIGPKQAKTIEPKASTSSTSTTKPKATSDVKKADKKKDKKAAKKDKKKAKKKAKKASKKAAKKVAK